MDPNRKRRARGLGAGKPDADLAKLTDAELLAAYEAERSGEAERERERERAARDPLFGHLQDLTDKELIAEYEKASAEVAAVEGEVGRRGRETAQPDPVAVAAPESPALEPHAVVLEPASPQPPPTRKPLTPQEAKMAEQNAIGCRLIEEEHQLAERREERDRALIAASEDEPMIEGSVRFGANASAELRQALNGR